ncbi:hypothetical protein [Nocardiopsis sp. MG754419]|uniref:hypothetical protein n=1 Tax=Nocardiopsis sp. MG754419 TaxID=2259865 RepID=UPI001BAA7D91|nr:hypothetical protein [Nocardiopsis sp. MG754419]MBR8744769.1 hypothetical protein [Nocardiopsis sp. MG754419]
MEENMADIDPSEASRNLQEAQTARQGAATTLAGGRVRWALAGGGVFAASVLVWLTGPDPNNLFTSVLLLVAVVAALLARSPRWAGLTGSRARMTGSAGRRVRTLALVTMIAVLVLFVPVNMAVVHWMGEPYPIAGAFVGIVLALAGPPFARWWMTEPESRG